VSRAIGFGLILFGLLLTCTLPAQEPRQKAREASTASSPPAATTSAEQEPPEEDPDLKPTEYAFNPLEAVRNITAGNFYYKKGNYRAAMRRYETATKWDPTSGEALLKLAAADEKLHDFPGAREAYTKVLALDVDAKTAAEVHKKLEKLPAPRPDPTKAKAAKAGSTAK
jgi:tetratricopeptide (TPR) repeat protein